MRHPKEDQITVVVRPSMKRALKIVAAEFNMGMGEYLRSLMDNDPRISAYVKSIEQKIGKLEKV